MLITGATSLLNSSLRLPTLLLTCRGGAK